MQMPADNSLGQEPEENKVPRYRSIKTVVMDQLMKDMQALNEQRETEIQTFRSRCQEQDMLISSIKKALNMDKLQHEFDVYRQDTGKKLRANEEALAEAQKDKKETEDTFKQLKKTIEQLLKERKTLEEKLKTSEEKSKTSEEKFNKEMEALRNELSMVKASRNQLEETLGKLERKPSISLDRVPLDLKRPSTLITVVDKSRVNDNKGVGTVGGSPRITCTPVASASLPNSVVSPSTKRRKA